MEKPAFDGLKRLYDIQDFCNKAGHDKLEVKSIVEDIVKIIRSVTEAAATCQALTANRVVVLNLGFRCYYKLLHSYELEDRNFSGLPAQLAYDREITFTMIGAILLTEQCQRLDLASLQMKCLNELLKAVEHNSESVLSILKILNLLVRKGVRLDPTSCLQLDHFYHCLRYNHLSTREETLTLYNHYCQHRHIAFDYFTTLVHCWPWTNRYKLYLLSGVLNSHNLADLLLSSEHNLEVFFAGVRMCLSFKKLLAASQYLVKSLSNQNNASLLSLSVDILLHGSLFELQNFHAQWYGRISQQDELFELLKQKSDLLGLLHDKGTQATDSLDQYRKVLVCGMFAKQLHTASPSDFLSVSMSLLENCFSYKQDVQLEIYRFLIDNINRFALETILAFTVKFFEEHKSIECAKFRNTMLGKFPTIINVTSKAYSRNIRSPASSISQNILQFFIDLEALAEAKLATIEEYQPRIFALKLLETLIKSLYAPVVVKNAKLCDPQQNRQLGTFLLAARVFDAVRVSEDLLELLRSATNSDDAQLLQVALLKMLDCVDCQEASGLCMKFCSSENVDEVALSELMAKVTLNSLKTKQDVCDLFQQSLSTVHANLLTVAGDPLLATKAGQHLFGYLSVLNEIVCSRKFSTGGHLIELTDLMERTVRLVLDFLNFAYFKKDEYAGEVLMAASFEDMDISLQMLVQKSAYRSENDEECRKYLLMTFWLTLKASCDLAASLACAMLDDPTIESAITIEHLRNCLAINTTVLTLCRHKGVIEAAGISIGRLTKALTSTLADEHLEMLHNCIERDLVSTHRLVSTTRRGAGFSIMFLHIMKNDEPNSRPLLKRTMGLILRELQRKESQALNNRDNQTALLLHYLCVLVKDTELRQPMSKYYNEIVLVAMEKIDDADWTVCNGSLQLFGALVFKLVGQQQPTELHDEPLWQPTELNYQNLMRIMPGACTQILDYCAAKCKTSAYTRSIILFLGFLSKVEHIRTDLTRLGESSLCVLLDRFREVMWLLLHHGCEQVRRLSATCLIRCHAFSDELPNFLLRVAGILYKVGEENFFQGLVFTLYDGCLKLECETKRVWSTARFSSFVQLLASQIVDGADFGRYTFYTKTKLLNLLRYLETLSSTNYLQEKIKSAKCPSSPDLGFDLWQEAIQG